MKENEEKLSRSEQKERIRQRYRGVDIEELEVIPALPKEVSQYRPSDKLRLLVVPGLTCYWQVQKNRNNVSFDEWMRLDRKYIMERNVLVDIKLIFKTFFFLFKKSGC